MIEKILIVDDEENVLNGIKRSLRKTKGLHAAVGAAKALEIIDAEGPFAVVIRCLTLTESLSSKR